MTWGEYSKTMQYILFHSSEWLSEPWECHKKGKGQSIMHKFRLKSIWDGR